MSWLLVWWNREASYHESKFAGCEWCFESATTCVGAANFCKSNKGLLCDIAVWHSAVIPFHSFVLSAKATYTPLCPIFIHGRSAVVCRSPGKSRNGVLLEASRAVSHTRRARVLWLGNISNGPKRAEYRPSSPVEGCVAVVLRGNAWMLCAFGRSASVCVCVWCLKRLIIAAAVFR